MIPNSKTHLITSISFVWQKVDDCPSLLKLAASKTRVESWGTLTSELCSSSRRLKRSIFLCPLAAKPNKTQVNHSIKVTVHWFRREEDSCVQPPLSCCTIIKLLFSTQFSKYQPPTLSLWNSNYFWITSWKSHSDHWSILCQTKWWW